MPSTRQIDDIWYVKYSIVQWSIKWYYKKDFYFQNFRPVYFVLKTNLYIVECFSNSFFSKLHNFISHWEKTSSNDLISTCIFCEIQFENKHYMKNDWQIVEIFRERYELTNFFLGKTILHHQNSSETSYSSR